ncbi:unnamed protein product [Absidia cylindrospora]
MPRFQPLPTFSFSIPYIGKSNTITTTTNANTSTNTHTIPFIESSFTPQPRSTLEAAISGDVTRLKQLWEQNTTSNMDIPYGPVEMTPLHYSASKEGETPLLKAAYAGHFSVVHYLVLEAGASVSHKDKDGWCALHNACSHGHLAMVQFLIAHSTTVDLKSKMDHTPLINAASKGHLSIVEHLISTANVDLFWKNKFGESAYDAAAVAAEVYICEQLEIMERKKMQQEGLDYQLLKQHGTIPVTVYEIQQQISTTTLIGHSFKSPTWGRHPTTSWILPSGEVVAKNRVGLPPLKDQQVWIWLTDWMVDYTHPNYDMDGWEYAKHLDTPDESWSNKLPVGNRQNAIRRRRWVRIMTRQSTHTADDEELDEHFGLMDDSSSHSGNTQDLSHDLDLEQWQDSSYIYRHEEASQPTSSTSITRANAAFVAGTSMLDYQTHDDGMVSGRRTLILNRQPHQGAARVWEKNENALDCRCCGKWFNIISRRHHCRQCGLIVCDRCSSNRAMLPYSGTIHDPQLPFDQVYKSTLRPQRICDPCFAHLSRPHTTPGTPNTPGTPGTTSPSNFLQRSLSMDSMMMYCPVCGNHLDGYGSTEQQEQHVQSCLNAGFSSASLSATGYVLYQAPSDSTLLGQECIICFEEFAQGDTIARLGCLCSYHHSCIHGWFSLGKGCPVHSQ